MERPQDFNRALLPQVGSLSEEESQWIFQCRRDLNRLGFCYQLIFVKVLNRFPQQEPLEIIEDILRFASLQIGISVDKISEYQKRRPTLSEHQLARHVAYGKRGKINARDFYEKKIRAVV